MNSAMTSWAASTMCPPLAVWHPAVSAAWRNGVAPCPAITSPNEPRIFQMPHRCCDDRSGHDSARDHAFAFDHQEWIALGLDPTCDMSPGDARRMADRSFDRWHRVARCLASFI
jgi:hypothetical protein